MGKDAPPGMAGMTLSERVEFDRLNPTPKRSKPLPKFVPGLPFTWADARRIYRSHSEGVMLLIVWQAKMKRRTEGLRVPGYELRDLGIGPARYARALRALEEMGFVRLARASGQSPRIDLLRSTLAFASGQPKSSLN